MYSAIALTFGYVESTKIAKIIFSTDICGPKTKKEALHSLTSYLFEKFKDDHSIGIINKCCLKTINNGGKFCPDCGKKREDGFNFGLWYNFLYELYSSDLDSYGSHDEIENPYQWCPWGFNFQFSKKNILIIDQHGAELLTIALLDLHPELKINCIEDRNFGLPDLSDRSNYLIKKYFNIIK